MTEDLTFLLISGILVFLLLIVGIVAFVIAYQKNLRSHQAEKSLLLSEFQNQLLESQLEISEQTMRQIAQEIHDNVGQRLTMVMHATEKSGDQDLSNILLEIREDLRGISHSLHSSRIAELGLDLALEKECLLVQKTAGLTCHYHPTEERLLLTPQEEVILFRCVQEAINNAIKYAEAKELNVTLAVSDSTLKLEVNDNGIGFEINSKANGLGLTSINERMQMIQGTFEIASKVGSGTTLTFTKEMNHGSD
ncbi:sensor histidine kinase [Sanyastnella coralliicola]|uniref:sensor histidine kinase n=1 Tax=Sanyastnella coralliicola TaxID=3069118 RepID=UPI0027B888DC|nr:sensor histidine kinase [Longitalea sp. SCSIO 12813]